MRLEIRRKPRASEDILEIWSYIAIESLRSADRVADRFEDVFNILAGYPEMGLARPELGEGLKSFPDGRYIIFYRHSSHILDIVRVVAAARKLSPDFFET
ncbi:type II toxin-antitoxin system RelE/ParE family toxin [Devosia sp.]|uniref:type II toxin-antitoxin system RelE/ParE family toxin n=1 Tax=Devosia sp. TaxID=1871048 RepID=UPI003BAC50D6